jgi:site-specific DNA recombinase
MSNDQVPAVLYAAKSTEDKRGSIPTQLEDCRAMVEREGWEAVGEFQDEGFSAYSGNRGPGLEDAKQAAATAAAERGEAVLVVQHSDRLARGAGDAPDAADHLVEVLAWANRHKVKLRTVQDDHLADPRMGQVMAAILGMRNTEDSHRKSEATRAGMRRSAEAGRPQGRAPLGYRRVGKGEDAQFIVVPDQAALANRIFREFVAGKPMKGIARTLQADGIPTLEGAKRWGQATISGILHNPTLIGKVKYDGELYEGKHEPIIDLELWNKAQKLIAARPSRGKGRPPSEAFMLRGLLRCGGCGEPMYPRKRIYECVNYDCPAGAISRMQIDGAIYGYFEREGLDVEATRASLVAARDSRLKEARAQGERAAGEASQAIESLDRIKRDYKNGRLDAEEWRELRSELEDERDAANAEGEQWHSRAGEIAAEFARLDAADELIDLLAEVRRSVAGEVKNAESVEVARSVMLRIFDQVVFHRLDADGNLPNVKQLMRGDQPEQMRTELLVSKRFVLEFRLREDVFDGVDAGGGVSLKPSPLDSLPSGPSSRAENKSNQGSGCLKRQSRSASEALGAGSTPKRSAVRFSQSSSSVGASSSQTTTLAISRRCGSMPSQGRSGGNSPPSADDQSAKSRNFGRRAPYSAACAAATRAIGTRKGEQLT